jgi:hypothetical protein
VLGRGLKLSLRVAQLLGPVLQVVHRLRRASSACDAAREQDHQDDHGEQRQR